MDNGQCKPAKCSRFAYSLFTKTKTGSLEKALKTRGFSAFSICEEDKECGAKKPASDASVKTLAKKCLLMAAPPTPNSSVRSWRRICWMLMEWEQLIAAPAFFHVPTHAIEHREFLRHWSARSKAPAIPVTMHRKRARYAFLSCNLYFDDVQYCLQDRIDRVDIYCRTKAD